MRKRLTSEQSWALRWFLAGTSKVPDKIDGQMVTELVRLGLLSEGTMIFDGLPIPAWRTSDSGLVALECGEYEVES